MLAGFVCPWMPLCVIVVNNMMHVHVVVCACLSVRCMCSCCLLFVRAHPFVCDCSVVSCSWLSALCLYDRRARDC